MKWHRTPLKPRSITPLGHLINTPIIRGLCVIIYAHIVNTRVDPDNPWSAPDARRARRRMRERVRKREKERETEREKKKKLRNKRFLR